MSKLGGFFFFFYFFPGLTLIKVSQSVSQSLTRAAPHNPEVVMVTYEHYVPSKVVFEDKVSGNYVSHYPVEDFPEEGYRFAVKNEYGQVTHVVNHLAWAIVIALLVPQVA